MRYRRGGDLPIWVQTISVRAPMNWGVAFLFRLSESSSTILPTANHSAALRRCLEGQ